MGKYISKSALVAEIERRMQELHPTNTHKMQVGEKMDRDVLMWLNALTWVKSLINTLAVKTVDLDFTTFCKEMDEVFALPSEVTKNTDDNPLNWEYAIAKHFFELGLSVNNPITAADRGIADEIIFALKTLGEEKMISYDKEIEWLSNKAQKGE